MRLIFLTIASAVLMAAQEKTMTVKRMTPNLYTDDVQACVKFWVDRLHFEKTKEVPDGDNLAFAALQKGNIELMYGSYASLEREPGDVARSFQRGTGFLFLEVDDLDAVLAAMKGVPMVAPMHRTFYGSTEFTVKDPAGHLITFAQFAKP
ncbi:MAG TPA: VOC family protein [Bryobacteraceae bacterium]|nr:VOC family protein [Bryobacteraceae bacterium]